MLINNPKFNIGDKVRIKVNRKKEFLGKVVYIFKKFEIPSKKKLIKYYGLMIINPKYGKLFGPMFEDRIVIKKKGKHKHYVILPMAGNRRHFNIIRT